MQEVKVVDAAYVRGMVMNQDVTNGLESGRFYLAIKVKKPTAKTKSMRQFRNRRLEAGYRRFEVLLPAHIYDALYSLRREGETFIKMFERLLSGDIDQTSMAQTHE
ncbi:hypothetical protein [Pseudomonas sp. VI4.1]|uniref:hypothetical protein n=1 Tax=Pseudomonas sp. VI4.1 TaxID=1941346 RepID=UPI0009D5AC8B|nr:hypothetical protein [Pseudomonas sp. VI4.1]OPK06782.1 hypothetical protein BZ163_29710 [Pseudomonas sp. VI4.1]